MSRNITARSIVRAIRRQFKLTPGGQATIYVLHFDQAVGHARHYIGFSGRDAAHRFKQHRSRAGSALVAELMKRGGDFVVALQFKISLARARTVERQLKEQHHGTRLCPLCARATMDRRNVLLAVRRARRRDQNSGAASPDTSTI